MKTGDTLFLLAVGFFICCTMFWFSGNKELAKEVLFLPVILALASMFPFEEVEQ